MGVVGSGPKSNLRSEKGLSLLETLIATAILAFALTSLTLAASTGMLTIGRVTRTGAVVDVARAQMEYVKRQPYASGATTYPTPSPDPYAPYTTAITASTVYTGLQTITVTVYSEGNQLFYLEGLKANR